MVPKSSLQGMLDALRKSKPLEAKGSLRSGEVRLTNESAQQQQPQGQQPGSSSLFGGTAQNTQAQPALGLFGNTPQQTQPQQSGGLFGNTQNAQSQPSSSLFGNVNQQPQSQQNSGLFGTANGQNQNPTTGTGGLFGGGSTTQNTQSTGGLFGGGSNTQQNPGTTSLFGGGGAAAQQNPGSNSLFGGNNISMQSNQLSSGSSLFGNPGNNNNTNGTTSSLFTRQSQPNTTNTNNSLFGGSASTSTAFGASTMQPPRQAPSLLSATQHNQINQAAPFGRLSMGQAAAAPASVSAAKVDYTELRPTTRFEDCIDSVKQELEAVDKMIQQQESFAKQIDAFLPKHEENVNSLAPDVAFVKGKIEDVEQALAADAHGVETQRRNADKDYKDVERVQRVVTNLALPSAWQYSSMGAGAFGSAYHSQRRPQQPAQAREGDDIASHDVDLIGNYFEPMAADLQVMMQAYAANLVEIENHMRVIEGSAVTQAHQLAQRRGGVNGNAQPNSQDTVRELAATLRGFEESILGVAGVVGECREGVNQLILGRLNGQSSNMA